MFTTSRLVASFLILFVASVSSQPQKCNHTPLKATVPTPSDQEHTFRLSIDTKQEDNKYLPDQTYVVTLYSTNLTRTFIWFLITAEDPGIDQQDNDQDDLSNVDVGSLKPLNGQSRYSERCAKTVEETDYSDKTKVEVHWISPKQSHRSVVRLRAMVAENDEVWYSGENLTLEISKNDIKSRDSPPHDPREQCQLCSEARYEVIFKGEWSRLTHPHHYPRDPDNNGYSDMIGASHDYNFNLWKPDNNASPGLKLLAEKGDISIMQRDIIDNISETAGVRTLIKGRGHMHPHMSEESYALFRVDRYHHLFSLVVALIPSPDWFLGTSMFELCTEDGWLAGYDIPLYPWDAGTANGISYESEKSVTQPVDNVQRVQVGSFDEASPFYQMNLNDLKPFASLKIRRLDVYEITDGSCTSDDGAPPETLEGGSKSGAGESYDEIFNSDAPNVAESKSSISRCKHGEWGEWSHCSTTDGACGEGVRTRTRASNQQSFNYLRQSTDNNEMIDDCSTDEAKEIERCVIDCYYDTTYD